MLPTALMVLALSQPAPRALPSRADAVRAIAEDSGTLHPASREFTRYVWVGSDPLDAKWGALTPNLTSRSAVLARPKLLASPAGLILRVDLRHYAPTPTDLKEWAETWEELKFDPAFSRLVTPDMLKFLEVDPADLPKVPKVVKKTRTVTKEWPGGRDKKGVEWPKGSKYDVEEEYEELVEVPLAAGAGTVLRLPDPTAEPALLAQLRAAHASEAVLVSLPYYVFRATSAFRGKGAYRQIYGGLYHDFMGFKTARQLKLDGRATDEDVIFQSLGLGRIAVGFSAKQLFEELRSDQRVAMFRSKVTGKSRKFFVVQTPNNRNGVGILVVTSDPDETDIDITQHPILNLEEVPDKAREGIFTTRNGLHGYYLVNGEGALQEEAPIAVVTDRTVPAPHPTKLQNGKSCLYCHWGFGEDGWKPAANDVKELFRDRLDAFGDLALKDQADAVDKIASRYTGDPETLFRIGRDDLARNVLKVTGPWPNSENGDQTDVVKLAGLRYQQIYNGYWYDPVDARTALRELGVEAPETLKEAAALLTNLVPPERSARFGGVIPEDARIKQLQGGRAVNRIDFDLTRSFIAERMAKNLPGSKT